MMKPEELKEKLKGVLVVMTTPFKSNFELDEEGLRKHTKFLIENGIENDTGCLIPTGSTGECPMLSVEERKRVLEIVLDEARGKVLVIAGCNHTDTRKVIELCQYAEEAGADGVMVSPPYYWRPSEMIIIKHYESIAKSIGLGILIYNNWFATQVDISVETIIKLAEIKNIIGIKENTPSLAKLYKVVASVGEKISVCNGNGEIHEPSAYIVGVKGFVSGIANFLPQLSVDLYKAEKEGDYAKAKDIYLKLAPLLDLMYGPSASAGQYISYIKAAMQMLGLPAGPPRPPLLPLTLEEKQQLKDLLDKLVPHLTVDRPW